MSRALNRALLEHEVMPTVNGDPVVESGSNADGEWTRWADGTQECYNSAFNITSSSFEFSGAWSYPRPFVDNNIAGSVCVAKNLDTAFPNSERAKCVPYLDAQASISAVGFLSNGGFTTGLSGTIRVIATGRWK